MRRFQQAQAGVKRWERAIQSASHSMALVLRHARRGRTLISEVEEGLNE
jgi:hypothetical protein